MKIVYLGTPDFSVEPLKAILNNGYDVVAVVCNKDKPFGRKKILTPPPVKQFALERNIKVFQYDRIRLEGVDDIKSLKPDLMITCAFGQILSQEIIDIPKYGVINIHASLLPKYRGASPINYAILNGEKKTGVTIMKTDAGIDTGDILLQEEIEILENETAGELFGRLSKLGADCIIKALKEIKNGSAKFIPQDNEKATFTKMIKKEHALIDWANSAEYIKNQIRAFNPSPVCYSFYNGEMYKFYSSHVVVGKFSPAMIVESNNQLVIGCGENGLCVDVIQKAGGKPMNIKDFLRGNKFDIGTRFTND